MNNYKTIDLDSYPRKEHFQRFLACEYPHITGTFEVDITKWLHHIKEKGYPFHLSFVYAAARAANSVPEFRRRIKDKGIIEYDYCNPSYTVALPDETYRFCMVNTNQPFDVYLEESKIRHEKSLHAKHLAEEGDPESLLFTTSTPWFYYTQANLPIPSRDFSIPNLGWGKYKTEKKLALVDGQVTEYEVVTIPFTIMAHHALVDGFHMSKVLDNLDAELTAMLSF